MDLNIRVVDTQKVREARRVKPTCVKSLKLGLNKNVSICHTAVLHLGSFYVCTRESFLSVTFWAPRSQGSSFPCGNTGKT